MFGAPPPHHLAAFSPFDSTKVDKLDPMQNQLCRVCDEPAAGFHFGAFTCEGCKSFFGRTCNNQSVIQECKNNYRCVINKKNRTACKACRLKKCLMVGMSKSGSRYGRRSNWFKIHCLMQQAQTSNKETVAPSTSSTISQPQTQTNPTPSLWRPLDSPSPKNSSPPPTLIPPPPKVQNFGASSSKVESKPQETPTFTPAPFNFYSPFMPFLPPTFNIPGLSTLPLQKQALLSPLLASQHFLAAARKAYLPQMATETPQISQVSDALAEHKALLERFRVSAAAMAAAAALNNNKQEEDEKDSLRSVSPPKSAGNLNLEIQKEDSSVSSVGSEEIIPHLSDTEDETEVEQDKKTKSDMPLDLTCV